MGPWTRRSILAVMAVFPLSVRMDNPTLRLTSASKPMALHVQAPDTERVQARVLDRNDHTVSHLRRVSRNQFEWDGRDSAGRPVRPGTYIVEVIEEPYSWSSVVSVVK